MHGTWLSVDEELSSVGAGSSSAINVACPPCHISGGAVWLVPPPLPSFVAVVVVVVVVVVIVGVVVVVVRVVTDL